MEFSAALVADIAELCDLIALDPYDITDPLATLHRDLGLAVNSYLGFELVTFEHEHPVVLTAFKAPGVANDVATSLRLPLSALSGPSSPGSDRPDSGPAGAFTVYASTPGALVDLAADLTYVLAGGHLNAMNSPGVPRERVVAGLRLDHDLTPASVTTGITGLQQVSDINRAVGFLMDQGFEPADAFSELARQAKVAGLTVVACAAALLRPGG